MISYGLDVLVVTAVLGVVWFKVVLPVIAWVFGNSAPSVTI